MPGLVHATIVVALLAWPAVAGAAPTVSLGAGGSVIVGSNLGATLDVHGAWWMDPSLAIAVRGSTGVLLPFPEPPADGSVTHGAVGPLLRRCRVSTCWSASSLLGFQRHRMRFVDGAEPGDEWHQRLDSLFVEGRLTGSLQFHPTVTLDAIIGLRGNVLAFHDNTRGYRADDNLWLDGVASLALSGHF